MFDLLDPKRTVFALALAATSAGACAAPPPAPCDVAAPDASADGAPPDASDAGGELRARGEVQVLQVPGPAGSGLVQWELLVGFTRRPIACDRRAVGACEVSACTVPASDRRSDDSEPNPHAGVVTVSGDSIAAPIERAPLANGYYPAALQVGVPLWRGGDTLRVEARGAAGGVPAFAQSLAAPAPVAVTTHVPTDGSALRVARAADFVVTWEPPSAASPVAVTFAAEQTVREVTTATTVVCAFAPEAGSGVVPAAALAGMPETRGVVVIGSAARARVAAGAWEVDVVATQVGTRNGVAARGGVEFY